MANEQSRTRKQSQTVREVVDAIEPLAPLHLAEEWDQVGLQVGRWDDRVSAGLLCIDFTPAVLDEAVEKKCGFVVAYHPPLFKPVERLTTGSERASVWKQEMLVETVRRGVAVYSPHTALDCVRGGFCDMLCDLVAGERGFVAQPIVPAAKRRDEHKVVVFVPESSEVAVREAMSAAGAGGIGNYRECSFSSAGTGGFRPIEGANPTIGEIGEREDVAERRLEMLVAGRLLPYVLAALREAHPYEEPAFDVFLLEPEPAVPSRDHGPGRLMILDGEQQHTVGSLAQQLAAIPGGTLKVSRAVGGAIRSIAVCPGAGGSLFENLDADAYITGEMQHHQVLDLTQRGKFVALAGHTNTERPLLPGYRELIEGTAAGALSWLISESDVAPLTAGYPHARREH